MTVITDLLDRIHTLNQTINYTGLTAYRYWPAQGKVPFIVPVLRSATHIRQYETDLRSTRTLELIVALGDPGEAVINQTAQRHAETVIDPILTVYGAARYLHNSSNQSLSSVIDDVDITQDSGIVYSQFTGRLQISFTLTIPLSRDLE